MGKEDLFAYGAIFLIVAATWALSSFAKMTITGFAASDTSDTTASLDINEFISITLTDGFPIDFGSLNPGTTNTSATTNPSNITIGEETNIAFNISYNASSGFYSPTLDRTIGASNMSLATNNITQTVLVLNEYVVGYEYQACPCGTSAMNQTWFYVDIPAGTLSATDYQLNMTIKASG